MPRIPYLIEKILWHEIVRCIFGRFDGVGRIIVLYLGLIYNLEIAVVEVNLIFYL